MPPFYNSTVRLRITFFVCITQDGGGERQASGKKVNRTFRPNPVSPYHAGAPQVPIALAHATTPDFKTTTVCCDGVSQPSHRPDV